MSTSISLSKLSIWFWIIAILGVLWNIFGVYQFMSTISGDVGVLMKNGLTREQAKLYASLPVWMNISFALGVFGGLIGSLLLFMKNKRATPVLLASLIGYIVLYIGDVTQGVFEIFGTPQVIILTTVVAIAIGLLIFSKYSEKKGYIK